MSLKRKTPDSGLCSPARAARAAPGSPCPSTWSISSGSSGSSAPRPAFGTDDINQVLIPPISFADPGMPTLPLDVVRGVLLPMLRATDVCRLAQVCRGFNALFGGRATRRLRIVFREGGGCTANGRALPCPDAASVAQFVASELDECAVRELVLRSVPEDVARAIIDRAAHRVECIKFADMTVTPSMNLARCARVALVGDAAVLDYNARGLFRMVNQVEEVEDLETGHLVRAPPGLVMNYHAWGGATENDIPDLRQPVWGPESIAGAACVSIFGGTLTSWPQALCTVKRVECRNVRMFPCLIVNRPRAPPLEGTSIKVTDCHGRWLRGMVASEIDVVGCSLHLGAVLHHRGVRVRLADTHLTEDTDVVMYWLTSQPHPGTHVFRAGDSHAMRRVVIGPDGSVKGRAQTHRTRLI